MYEFDLEIYAEKIFVFKGIYKNPEYAVKMYQTMDSLVSEDNTEVFHKSTAWQTSGEVPHTYGTKIMTNRSNLKNTKNQEVIDFYNQLEEIYQFAGKFYFDKLGIKYDPEYLKHHALFHYYNGQEMGPHVDDYNVAQTEALATGLIYLNDDKVGGDLRFINQNVIIESKAGNMVIFPSVEPFFHSSTQIVEGEKYHIGNAWKRNRSEEEVKNWKS